MSNASEKEIKIKKEMNVRVLLLLLICILFAIKKINKFLSHILCKSSLSKSDILYVKWKNRSAFRKIRLLFVVWIRLQ